MAHSKSSVLCTSQEWPASARALCSFLLQSMHFQCFSCRARDRVSYLGIEGYPDVIS